MSAPSTVDDFLGLVRKSGLLDEKQFASLFPDKDDLPAEPLACASALIKAGLLTQFQARQLLAGKFHGFLLGVYKILSPIGKGGMGTVLLAEHTTLKRQVALKVLPADKAKDPIGVERFYREARAVAALDHPNIVQLHDVSQGAGVHFLVMEYVEGKNLQALVLEAGPLHYAQACHYIAQAAEGLQHAHEKGFIHRDIKPANLILAKDGTVKILDMGQARSFHDDVDNLTGQLGDKMVVGSVDFMSPEQARGQPVDERSDIYSLGATLYALITGHPPFKGETTQVLMQHQMAPLPQLSQKLRGTVPPALYDLLAKMMAKSKWDRPRSCADVIEALIPWLPAPTSGTAVHDAPSTRESKSTGASTTRSRSRRRRRKTETSSPSRATKLWIGGGVGVLALLMIFLATWGFGGKDAKPTNPAGMPPANPENAPFTQLIQVGTGGALSVAESTDQFPGRAVIAPANEKDPAQHWKFLEIGPHYKVVNRKTGKVLDVVAESTEEGAQIILWMNKTENADNQLWRWDEQGPERLLLTKKTGMALDIDADGKAVQRRVDVNAKQRWRVIMLK